VADPLVFVDTNVLVYAHDRADAVKQRTAASLLETLWEEGTGALSTQVLQEFYVVATRKLRPALSRREARALVAAYGAWHVVTIEMPLIVAASELEQRHRLSFWDALIIVAARHAGAERLMSEDLQTGRRVAGLKIQNPFEPPGT